MRKSVAHIIPSYRSGTCSWRALQSWFSVGRDSVDSSSSVSYSQRDDARRARQQTKQWRSAGCTWEQDAADSQSAPITGEVRLNVDREKYSESES
jgi:hypothetical protein